jgi:hypothetical protein
MVLHLNLTSKEDLILQAGFQKEFGFFLKKEFKNPLD